MFEASFLGLSWPLLSRYVAKGEHCSKTRARRDHHTLNTGCINDRHNTDATVDGNGLMRREIQKISMCAHSVVVLMGLAGTYVNYTTQAFLRTSKDT